jgi:hypothetical protein
LSIVRETSVEIGGVLVGMIVAEVDGIPNARCVLSVAVGEGSDVIHSLDQLDRIFWEGRCRRSHPSRSQGSTTDCGSSLCDDVDALEERRGKLVEKLVPVLSLAVGRG